jgi:integrase
MTQRRRGHGEGSIYKRSDGRWAAAVDLGTRVGKRRRKTVYGKSQADVIRKVDAVRQDLRQGKPIPIGRVKVGDWLAEWLKDCVKPRVRPSTYGSYEVTVRLHISPYLGDVVLTDLRARDIERWLAELAENGVKRRNCRYARVVLRAALEKAVKEGCVATNQVKLTDAPPKSEFKPNTLTPDQVETLLAVAGNERLGQLFALAVACGLRQGEVLGLQWSNVNLAARELHVCKQLQRHDKGLVLVEPKSESSVRMVPLTEVALDALTRQRAQQREERMRAGGEWQISDFVFTSPVGAPLSRYYVHEVFKRLLRQASLPSIRFHDLRHTCATLFVSRDVPLNTVSAIMGHSSIQITADLYAHVLGSMKHDAARKMDQALVGNR